MTNQLKLSFEKPVIIYDVDAGTQQVCHHDAHGTYERADGLSFCNHCHSHVCSSCLVYISAMEPTRRECRSCLLGRHRPRK